MIGGERVVGKWKRFEIMCMGGVGWGGVVEGVEVVKECGWVCGWV